MDLPVGNFELKIFDNTDKETLNCMICDLPHTENIALKYIQYPEYIVVMRSPAQTIWKGLHKKCMQLTRNYTEKYDKMIMEQVLE